MFIEPWQSENGFHDRSLINFSGFACNFICLVHVRHLFVSHVGFSLIASLGIGQDLLAFLASLEQHSAVFIRQLLSR